MRVRSNLHTMILLSEEVEGRCGLRDKRVQADPSQRPQHT